MEHDENTATYRLNVINYLKEQAENRESYIVGLVNKIKRQKKIIYELESLHLEKAENVTIKRAIKFLWLVITARIWKITVKK